MRKTLMQLAVLGAVFVAWGDESAVESRTDSWSGRRTHLAVVNPSVPADDGNVLSLGGEWEFSHFRHALEARDMRYVLDRDFWGRESVGWKNLRTINVPGCWEEQGVGEKGRGYSYAVKQGNVVMRHVHLGNGFYRKRVTVPAAWKGKRIWLKVGQARLWAWAWIDDKAVAHFSEAHRALKWDVTDLVTPGRTCVVKFQIDNSYVGWRNTQTLSYNRWGGLTRDVELEATPATYIDDAWVRGVFDSQEAEVHVTVRSAAAAGERLRATVEGTVVDLAVSSVSPTHELRLPLPRMRPWSPEHPNLYTARVELVSAAGEVLQTRYERFGVRKLEVRGKEFYLNGKPFFFRGFGDDSTYPITGLSPASKEFHLKNMLKARAAGFNFVRLHTHCEHPEYFDAADEAGVFVQPELSYNCDESSCEPFEFDPPGDARAIWQGYRRHPSFAVYSGGNEGTLGPNGGKSLFNWVHANDPDRLVIEQDGGTYMEGHRADTSDYASGPMSMWERGTFNKRAFICHEYANLAVKADARLEDRFTGTWMPRFTRERRRAYLKPAGLGEKWGDFLQDAQHDLQRMWAIRSVEAARKDPYCDGYIFWTIVDYMHLHRATGNVMCQGLFNAFWETKSCGTSPEAMAVVNSPTAILLDTEDRVRIPQEDTDPMLCCGSTRRLVIDETNRVYTAGQSIPAEFILAHYGEEDLAGVSLDWELSAGERRLAGGRENLGDQRIGPARRVAKFPIAVPSLDRPVKATLRAAVLGASGRVTANAWNFWLFPGIPSPSVPDGVVVAPHGSAEAEAARKAGKNLLLTGNLGGVRDIYPGWWSIDWRTKGLTQNGVAVKRHELFRDFPYERFLSPLLFGMIGQATPLPVAGFAERDFIAVGEGNDDFKLYLAAKTRPDGGREVFVSGLDVMAASPEARTLLSDIYGWLAGR